ncbi:MAG TPA: outer membrane lipoprotein carrier protein LolA [Kofleriaceae bacterium]|nr:outer membrane lipoprotein carrier protein LolA [Kofleriaceae bacterium]
MRAFISATLLCVWVSTASAQPSATQAVQQVQQFYANIKQVTAMFRQEVTNNTFGSTKQSDGTVWLVKPGKMRWDYLEKKPTGVVVKKSFISDGKELWVVDHENKQVLKKNLQQDMLPVAVTFLYGTGDLTKEFNPAIDTSSSYGAKGDVVLKLTPKQPSAQYKALYLVTNATDSHVKESIIVDSSGNVNHFHFFAPDFQKPIADNIFEFNPASVKSYRIVDADQPPPAQGSGATAPLPPPPAPNK